MKSICFFNIILLYTQFQHLFWNGSIEIHVIMTLKK